MAAGLEGQTLGEFRILKRLGEGGMGQVYLAEQVRVGRQVAIKVLRPPRPSNSSDESEPPMLADAPERFKREALAVGKLDHPNILPVHDFGTEQELMYLVMPYLPDGSLFDAMRPGGSKRRFTLPLNAAQAAPLIFQAASALQYAHDRNIIHRDVKPENFLIRVEHDGSIQILLADFGLVKEYHPGSGTATMAVGTADYVAPEQIEGRPVPASDQYALAVMTYELLTGQLPFSGSVAEVALKHMRQEPPSPRKLNPRIPTEIEEVVLTALRKRAGERWPSIIEYARAYSEALKQVEQRRAGQHPIEEEKTVVLPPGQPAAQKPRQAEQQNPQPAAQKLPVQKPATPEPPAQKQPAAGPPPTSSQPPRVAYPPQPPAAPAQGYPAPGQGHASSPPAPRPPVAPPAAPGYQRPAYPPANFSPAQSWPPANSPPPRGKGSRFPVLLVAVLVVLILLVAGVVLFLTLSNGKQASPTLTPTPPSRPTLPSRPTPPSGPQRTPRPLLLISGLGQRDVALFTQPDGQVIALIGGLNEWAVVSTNAQHAPQV